MNEVWGGGGAARGAFHQREIKALAAEPGRGGNVLVLRAGAGRRVSGSFKVSTELTVQIRSSAGSRVFEHRSPFLFAFSPR